MTLAEYILATGTPILSEHNGCIFLLMPPQPNRMWDLFHLDDYTVSSVSGPGVYLIPRHTPPAPRIGTATTT